MHPRLFTLGSLTCLLAAGTAIAGDIAAAHTCTSFDLKNVSEATVTGRTFYKAGDNVTLGNLDEAVSTTSLPSFCRIQLVITTNTTANSSAQTEVWLPVNWNQRFVTFGNGGLGGGGQRAHFLSMFNLAHRILHLASYQDLAYIAAKQGCMSSFKSRSATFTDFLDRRRNVYRYRTSVSVRRRDMGWSRTRGMTCACCRSPASYKTSECDR